MEVTSTRPLLLISQNRPVVGGRVLRGARGPGRAREGLRGGRRGDGRRRGVPNRVRFRVSHFTRALAARRRTSARSTRRSRDPKTRRPPARSEVARPPPGSRRCLGLITRRTARAPERSAVLSRTRAVFVGGSHELPWTAFAERDRPTAAACGTRRPRCPPGGTPRGPGARCVAPAAEEASGAVPEALRRPTREVRGRERPPARPRVVPMGRAAPPPTSLVPGPRSIAPKRAEADAGIRTIRIRTRGRPKPGSAAGVQMDIISKRPFQVAKAAFPAPPAGDASLLLPRRPATSAPTTPEALRRPTREARRPRSRRES